ncbi:sulfotransferase family 2 domain-containing protein [Bradyrhizobium guangdongense]|uniref:sulfotransferase family 2 domain-containing protein n=1 Tax=Bradyrhizobium guangdongense TaxID=1325090 RepID=UPI0016428D4C|nr:sulfotransferase family 2 domain-containing protein [Bradyrhizobium guangdongense]
MKQAASLTAERPFFFLHIRKTAGVSLRGLLANRFPADRILFQAHSRSGPQRPGNALFATGHVDFDYAGSFPIHPTIFTVLREPMSRCVSAHDFFQSHSEPFFQTLATELSTDEYAARRRYQERARALGPKRFLGEEEPLARYWLANVQTRQLAGASFASLRDDDPRLLDAALTNLARIDLTGILERQADTLKLLGRMMGWGPLGPLAHLNRTPRSSQSELDPASLHILHSWNELDLRLYEEAHRLFEHRLAASPSAEDKVQLAAPLGADGFTPDQPLHGAGWHERERHEGRWLCWNSAPSATLNLQPATPAPRRFQCLLSHVFNEHALNRIGIAINDRPLVLRKRAAEGGILIESDIPASAWAADPAHAVLTFQCPVMGSPQDLDPNSSDARQLGFALARVLLD